ncbi:MAG: hypothetical protein ABW215_14110, partial [Kibdelosporangium sp.]
MSAPLLTAGRCQLVHNAIHGQAGDRHMHDATFTGEVQLDPLTVAVDGRCSSTISSAVECSPDDRLLTRFIFCGRFRCLRKSHGD